MPYISSADRREALDQGSRPRTQGELNYCLTRWVDRYITGRGLSYDAINEAVGALECAKLELYRRLAAPLEDKKCSDNGEVYHNAPERSGMRTVGPRAEGVGESSNQGIQAVTKTDERPPTTCCVAKTSPS
jgi:hypothetical protein